LRQLERDISHITGCTNNIQHVVGRVRYTNVASVEQRYTLGVPVVNGSCKKIKCKSCKLTAVSMSSSMRARSLSPCLTATKTLSAVGNSLCRRQLEGRLAASTILSPTGGPPIPQEASAARHGIAIPVSVSVLAPTPNAASANRARSAPYVHNNRSTDRLRFCVFLWKN
jgi:hypothetical protein